MDGIDPNDLNPMLAETDEVISDEKALINDIFRIMHDFFGHAKGGVPEDAGGNELLVVVADSVDVHAQLE